MQGGLLTFEAIDDKRIKCSVCQKIIYKILEKAHANGHAQSQIPLDSIKSQQKILVANERLLIENGRNKTKDIENDSIIWVNKEFGNKVNQRKECSQKFCGEVDMRFGFGVYVRLYLQFKRCAVRLMKMIKRFYYLRLRKVFKCWRLAPRG